MTGNQRTILEALDAFDEGLMIKQLEDITAPASSTVFNVLQRLKERSQVGKGSDAERKVVYALTGEGREALA